MSYSYPKVTGETVFAKDPADGKVKLLDTIIQLLRTADSGMVNQINQALQAITQINTDIAGVWKSGQSNLPAANNTYDIGSASQMIRSIYSMGMTLGREGYEWEINSNDGYVILSSGLMIQWRQVSGSNSDRHSVTFTTYFPTALVFATATAITSINDTVCSFKLYSYSRTSMTYQFTWANHNGGGYASEDHICFAIGY